MIPLILDNRIRIKADALLSAPSGFLRELKESLTFANPQYNRLMKWHPDRDIPRQFFGFYETNGWLLINRGWMNSFIRLCQKYRTKYEIDDRTVIGEKFPAVFRGTLKGYQAKAMREMKRFGWITGPAGSGKKVLAAACIGEWRTPALVIVKSQAQLWQWEEILKTYLDCPDEVGLIGAGKNDRKQITVAINKSLYRHVQEIKKTFGAVIIDKPEVTDLRVFSAIVAEMPSYHMLGLARAPMRTDGNTAYIQTYTGQPFAALQADPYAGQGGRRTVELRKTCFAYDYKDDWHEMISSVAGSDCRNAGIAEDILAETAETARRAIVLSERTEHLHDLKSRMEMRNAEVVNGTTGKEAVSSALLRFGKGELQVVFCTYKSIDKLAGIRPADCVFIASPVKFSPALAQITGRLTQPNGKIYDYADNVNVLDGSLSRRLKYYKQMGFKR